MRTIGGLLTGLRLRVQIGLLAALGIVGLLALAGFFVYSDSVATASLARSDRATRVFDSVAAYDRALLVAKKAEKNFLATGRPAEVKAHATAVAGGVAALQALRAAGEQSGDAALRAITARADEFRAATDTYVAAFGELVALSQEVGGDQTSGLQRRLQNSAAAAEAVLARVADPRVHVRMLLLQRDASDFLRLLSGDFRDRLDADIGGFNAAVAGADLDDAAVTAIAVAMAAYRADFLALAPKKLELAAKTARISTFYSNLEPKLTGWKDQVLAVRDAAGAALAATRAHLRVLAMWVTGAMLLAMLGLAALVGIGLTRALDAIAGAMDRLVRDDLDFDLAALGGRGEVGRMATALGVFRATAQAAARLRAEVESARAAAEASRRQALVGMAETIERETAGAVTRVAAMTAQMDATAATLAQSAGRTSGSADQAVAAATQAQTAAQAVAGAVTELTATVGEVTRQIGQSAAISRQAVTAVHDARLVMETLSAQAGRIGDVARLIGDIARKTNLLALNATIEAARAGEAGRGFAVVAGEVKSLAAQTARATAEISRELAAIAAATGRAVDAVLFIDSRIGEADAIGSTIAAAAEQQRTATARIAGGVGETAAAARTVSARVAEVADEAALTGRQTQQVSEESAALNGAVRDLKSVVVRIVRTSTSEVERREDVRHVVDVPCLVETADGRSFSGRLADVSTGGALVRTMTGTAPVGGRVQLRVQSEVVQGEAIMHGEADALSVQFDTDAANARMVAKLLVRIRAKPVPRVA